ncbi:hypothetical protein [Sphingomonas sp. RB1R13]|uniref:hypothetical protein n=1 Tax=Sphingomonas sp. RB1R13 TaxID=3096159 RepID=UPI002FC83AB5
MRTPLPLFAALALGACATLPPKAPTTTGTATASYGQTANVGPLLIQPIALVEDSRCPINARCIWAGRLVIKTCVTFHGGREQMLTNITLGTPLTIGAGQVTLVAGEPGRLAGAQGNPPANRFTFDYAAMR